MTDEPAGEVVIYQSDEGLPALNMRLAGDTAWLSQQQLAQLFQTSRTNIVEHIQNVYAERELGREATCRNFRQVRTEGSRQVARELPFYNLDLIISVGYRVKSKVATQFRIWATERLREYLIKGFTMDDAAEVIAAGADASKRNMELTAFAGVRPPKSDISVAEGYLAEREMKRLSTLVSTYFDAAEFRSQNHEPTYVNDWLDHPDRLMVAMEAPLLSGARSVSQHWALSKAEGQYRKFRIALDAELSGVERRISTQSNVCNVRSKENQNEQSQPIDYKTST